MEYPDSAPANTSYIYVPLVPPKPRTATPSRHRVAIQRPQTTPAKRVASDAHEPDQWLLSSQQTRFPPLAPSPTRPGGGESSWAWKLAPPSSFSYRSLPPDTSDGNSILFPQQPRGVPPSALGTKHLPTVATFSSPTEPALTRRKVAAQVDEPSDFCSFSHMFSPVPLPRAAFDARTTNEQELLISSLGAPNPNPPALARAQVPGSLRSTRHLQTRAAAAADSPTVLWPAQFPVRPVGTR